MTSEMEGSDWRFEGSSSTGFRGSTEEIMLEMLGPEVWCGYPDEKDG